MTLVSSSFHPGRLATLILLAGLTVTVAAGRSSRSEDRLVNLRGTWLFSVGDDARRALPDFNDDAWSSVRVPGNWEDEGYRDYNGYAWYRRTFSFDEDPAQLTYLLLGRIDDADEVFLNGKRIGGTGAFPPHYATAYNQDRIYGIQPGTLRAGENVIAIRVYDGAQVGGIRGDRIGIYSNETPLPEIVLTGEWIFRPGDDPEWKDVQADESQFKPISVPAYWEDTGYDFDGFAWYRKTFSAPAQLSDTTLVLMLGRIDDTDEVYLNGTRIGGSGSLTDADRHSGADYYAQQRGYTFPASLLKETNVLAVRVHDHGGRGGIYDGPLGIIGQSRYIAYWETVRRDHDSPGWTFLRAIFRDDD